jgi:hypothetical protein
LPTATPATSGSPAGTNGTTSSTKPKPRRANHSRG